MGTTMRRLLVRRMAFSGPCHDELEGAFSIDHLDLVSLNCRCYSRLKPVK